MKRYYIMIGIALLVALAIYLFYRTEKTVVNLLFDNAIGMDNAASLRSYITTNIRLPKFFIYSLPGGIWVFAATLVSRRLICKLGNFTIRLACLPTLYAISLELLQLLKLLPGTFDFLDIGCALLLGLLANAAIKCPLPTQHVFQIYNFRSSTLLSIYAIVFLSHVQQ